MFLQMMDSVMEEVVSYLFRIQVRVTGQDEPPQGVPIKVPTQADLRRVGRRSVADEEAAARSEIHLTAQGLLAPAVQKATVITKGAVASERTAQTAQMREARPGSAGRRNKKKK
jgi:hypothetical protein